MKLSNFINEEFGKLNDREEKRLRRLIRLQKFIDPKGHQQTTSNLAKVEKAEGKTLIPSKELTLRQTHDEFQKWLENKPTTAVAKRPTKNKALPCLKCGAPAREESNYCQACWNETFGAGFKKGDQVEVKGSKGPHTVIKKKGPNNWMLRSPHGGVVMAHVRDIHGEREVENGKVLPSSRLTDNEARRQIAGSMRSEIRKAKGYGLSSLRRTSSTDPK